MNTHRQTLIEAVVQALRASNDEKTTGAVRELGTDQLVVLAVELGVISPPPPAAAGALRLVAS